MLGDTQGEYEKGWIPKPTRVTKLDMYALATSPIFRIAEKQGKQGRKYRPIEHLTKLLVNSASAATETNRPQALNAFINISREHACTNTRNNCMRSVDFPHAYKTIGMRPDSDTSAYIFTPNPNDGDVYTAKLAAQTSGG